MSEQISILGTGWLGLPLAKALIQKKYIVKGSTTSGHRLEQLSAHNIIPFKIAVTEQGPTGDIASFLKGSTILIINIPPGLRRNPEIDFVSKIRTLIPHIEESTITKVLFIGSTSVFADLEGFPIVSKETQPNATSNAGKQLIETEKLLQKNKSFKTTILRFAGLYGPNRHPATMLSKRTNIKNPKAPVNLIHLDDCIGIILKILKINAWDDVFNASSSNHPKKFEYYSKICREMRLSEPDYDFETPSKGKVITSDMLIHKIGYQFTKSI